MNSESESQNKAAKPTIKIFGVGTAGLSMLEQVMRGGVDGADFVAVNTEEASLWASSAPEKVHLEPRPLRGLGTGGDPARGRAAAEEAAGKLKSVCEGSMAVFIVAGLGGGAGTGICPVLAQAAKETGALALGFVTMPFDCEGRRRQTVAKQGLLELKAAGDGVICLPNQKVFKLIDERTSVVDTFKLTDQLLAEGVRGIWRLLAHKGLLQIHFEELCGVLKEQHGESAFAATEASGLERSREVVEKLLAHPMLDGGEVLKESSTVLVSLTGGPDLAMSEVHKVMEEIQRRCEPAQVLMGAAIDESFRERLSLTLIAGRKNEETAIGEEASSSSTEPERVEAEGRMTKPAEALDTQLLPASSKTKPGSRFVPPAPTLPPEQVRQMLERQKQGARGRKPSSKMRQAQLPLEIISKGRFDKSEPTIHLGEDLDVPTYIRRGISLN
jgi:cell division protein FtsZ